MTGEDDTTLRIVCMYCRKVMGYKPGHGVSGDSHSICEECWEKEFPGEPYPREGQPLTSSRYDNMVRHLGYDPSELNEEQKANLVQESQQRLAGVRPIPDGSLYPAQQASLSLARAIAKRRVYAAYLPPASDRVTTAGMYSRSTGEIYISPEQLEKGEKTVATAIHELAHHTSGAEDGEPEHAAEIANLANQVVAATRRGDYDKYLSGEFHW